MNPTNHTLAMLCLCTALALSGCQSNSAKAPITPPTPVQTKEKPPVPEELIESLANSENNSGGNNGIDNGIDNGVDNGVGPSLVRPSGSADTNDLSRSAQTRSDQTQPAQPTTNAATDTNQQTRQLALGSDASGVAVASLPNKQLAEVSGLTFTQDNAARFWVVNDSGNKAMIFALDKNGRVQHSVNLNIKNRDWEDLDVLHRNGEHYIVIADIGDNLERHSEYTIHFFSESSLLNAGQAKVSPVNSLHFRYDDGPHNSEAMFVDGDYVYLLSKERLRDNQAVNGGVYQLPISLQPTSRLTIAKRIGTLGLPGRSIPSRLLARLAGLDMEQPTASAIAPSGDVLYVLNYRNILAFKKEKQESWGSALSRLGVRLHTHDLPQAEALGVAANGDVWVMSEKLPAQIWRFPAVQN